MKLQLSLGVPVAATLLVLTASAWQQQGGQPQPRPRPNTPPGTAPTGPPPKPGTLAGSVTNSLSHAPIRQATVFVIGGQGHSFVGVTGDDGKFRIANVDPGTYFLGQASAKGYHYKPPTRVISAQIVVAEGQDVTGVKVELEPQGVIAGKVVDDDGEPVRDAQVQTLAYDYSRGTKMLSTMGATNTTDDRGEYRLFNLNPGRYMVRVKVRTGADASPPNTHRTTPVMGYAPTYYPNGSEPAQAVASEVTPGSEVSGINFRLRSVPVYHIRGKVNQMEDTRNAVGITAAECGGSVASSNPDQLFAVTQPGGQFDISGVTPGTWCVTQQRGGQGSLTYASETASVTDHSVDGLVLNPVVLSPLSGVIQVDGQSTQQPNVTVSLQRTTGYQGATTPARDGKFTMNNLMPETYEVMVRGLPQGWYLKSMQYGTQDVSDGLLSLRNDGGTLTLVLGTDGGQLNGTIQTDSGDPGVNARVIVAPADRFANRRDLLKMAAADATGHFQTADLAPGDYKVYAWDDPDVPMWLSADFRKELSSRAVTVTVGPGSPSTVQVTTVPPDDVTKAKAKFQ